MIYSRSLGILVAKPSFLTLSSVLLSLLICCFLRNANDSLFIAFTILLPDFPWSLSWPGWHCEVFPGAAQPWASTLWEPIHWLTCEPLQLTDWLVFLFTLRINILFLPLKLLSWVFHRLLTCYGSSVRTGVLVWASSATHLPLEVCTVRSSCWIFVCSVYRDRPDVFWGDEPGWSREQSRGTWAWERERKSWRLGWLAAAVSPRSVLGAGCRLGRDGDGDGEERERVTERRKEGRKNQRHTLDFMASLVPQGQANILGFGSNADISGNLIILSHSIWASLSGFLLFVSK